MMEDAKRSIHTVSQYSESSFDTSYDRLMDKESHSFLGPTDKNPHERQLLPTPAAMVSGWRKCSNYLVDIIVVMGAVPFFVFADAVFIVNGRIVNDDHYRLLIDYAIIAGALFPILFTYLIGRATSKAASWSLQRGSTLLQLEQLNSCKTLVQCVKTSWKLRAFNPLGAFLVFLWLTSPFGALGIMRATSAVSGADRSNTTILYGNTGSQSSAATFYWSEDQSQRSYDQFFQQPDVLYSSSLLATDGIKNGPLDVWGNMKVPLMSSYARNDSNAWTEVPHPDNITFSSLIGVPITGIPMENTTFMMESTYVEIDCNRVSIGPTRTLSQTVFLKTQVEQGLVSFPREYFAVKNGTFQGYNAFNRIRRNSTVTNATWSLALDTFVDTRYNATAVRGGRDFAFPGFFANQTDIQADEATLLVQSTFIDEGATGIARLNRSISLYCAVSQVYVESNVSCTIDSTGDRHCLINAQRASQQPHAPSAITQLSWPEVFQHISYRLPRVFRITDWLDSDYSMFYLQDPSTSAIATANGVANFSPLPLGALSARLGQLINTYLTTTQTGLNIIGDPVRFDDATRAEISLSSIAQVDRPVRYYQISWPWLSIYVLSVLLMFLAGWVSVLLTYAIKTPEILGSASSAIRDSQFIQLPPTSRKLGGIGLSRREGALRLKMGPVWVNDDGSKHIGVSTQSGIFFKEG